jgi:hypothetical protein
MERNDFEHDRQIPELDFSRLEAGDEIVIDTESGSVYKFTMTSNEDGTALATLERRSDHAPVRKEGAPRWEEVGQDTIFRLVGSCKNVEKLADGSFVVDTTDGHFVVGERAHVETQGTDEGGTLITRPIQSIQLDKLAQRE